MANYNKIYIRAINIGKFFIQVFIQFAQEYLYFLIRQPIDKASRLLEIVKS